VDLRLDHTGDLAVTPSGDLDLVGNAVPIQNIWQAVTLRLLTTLGTYLFQDGYGTLLRRFVAQPMTPSLRQQIKNEVNTTVLADPRVKQITRLEVAQSTDPQGYQIALSIVTVSSQTIGGTLTVTGD
jgi:phage baseplate assembly protein W